MKKLTVIYWSGTGNTEAMATAIEEAGNAKGYETVLKNVDSASLADVEGSDYLAFGCPAMGSEELEDEMESFMNSISSSEAIKGKETVLFGSYDWGDGEWMRDWEESVKGMGLNLVAPGLTINETPDAAGLDQCRALVDSFSE